MATNMDARSNSGMGTGRKLGWLTWWTIHQAELEVATVAEAGRAAAIPQWMIDRINGRTDRSAWLHATQLGARGVKSAAVQGDPMDSAARFLVRDIKANEARAIVREVTDAAGEKVSADTVAMVYLGSSGLTFQVAAGVGADLDQQVRDLIQGMDQQMGQITGKMDYGRVRALIIDWLEKRHRVTVRGSGGVYLVPRPKTDAEADEIERELVAIRDWSSNAPLNSLFSIVEVSDSGATTVDSFRQAAIDELRGEIEEVNSNLLKWAGNDRMNDGSKMFSADTMMVRLETLRSRMTALVESLGEEVGVVELMLGSVEAKARDMRDGSTSAIQALKDAAKAERQAKLDGLKAARDAAAATKQADKQAASATRAAEAEAARKAKADAKAAAAAAKVKPVPAPDPVVASVTKPAPKPSNGRNGKADDETLPPPIVIVSDEPMQLDGLKPATKSKKQGVSKKAPVKL